MVVITIIAAIIMQTKTLTELIVATQEGALLADIRAEDNRQQIHPLVQDQAVRDQAEQDLVEMGHTAMQIRMLTIEIVQHDMTERVLR